MIIGDFFRRQVFFLLMVAFAFIFGFRKSIREMEGSDLNELVNS